MGNEVYKAAQLSAEDLQRELDVPAFSEQMAEIISRRFSRLVEAAHNYLQEFDTPVPDYNLRVNYRKQLRAALAEVIGE